MKSNPPVPPSFSGRRLFNEFEVADMLGLEVSTLRRWRWSGDKINFVRIGSRVRYAIEDIDEFIAAGRRSNTSEKAAPVAAGLPRITVCANRAPGPGEAAARDLGARGTETESEPGR